MSITKTSGMSMAVVSTYGALVAMSAITNAAEAVATLAAAHGVVVGDYLEVTSGWGRLDKRIVRAKTVVTNDVTFESINTTSTTNYPAGSGIGSIRRINAASAFTSMTQIKLVSTSGGEMAFEDITAIDDVVSKQLPTIRSPVQLQLTVFDDPTLAWYTTLAAADDAGTPTAFRMSFPNGSKLVFNAYVSVGRVPQIEANASLKTSISLSFVAEPTRYAT